MLGTAGLPRRRALHNPWVVRCQLLGQEATLPGEAGAGRRAAPWAQWQHLPLISRKVRKLTSRPDSAEMGEGS